MQAEKRLEGAKSSGLQARKEEEHKFGLVWVQVPPSYSGNNAEQKIFLSAKSAQKG